MLQIILLLVRGRLYPSPPETQPAEDDESRGVEPEEYVPTRKKKRKKPRTESLVSEDKPTAKKARQDRRKKKGVRPALDEEQDEGYRPEVVLDMLADRIALWHAIGSGSDTAQGNKGNEDGRVFEADSDSDEEPGAWTRPSRRVVEEWDWAQRFCVNVVER